MLRFCAAGEGLASPGSTHAKAMPKRKDSVNSQRVTNSPKLLPEKGRCRRAGTSRRPYGGDGAAFLCRKRFGKIVRDFAKPFFYMDLCRRGG